jgi:hypothetical protein
LTNGWRVGENARGEVLHEHLHRLALVAKKVVDLGEYDPGNVAGACLIDGLAKRLVVRGALDEIVDECPGVAISAAALRAGTEQLALVAAFPQRSDDARTSRLGVSPVLIEHQRQVLSDEFRARMIGECRRSSRAVQPLSADPRQVEAGTV